MHVLEQKELFFFFRISVPLVGGEFIHSLKFQKDIPTKEMHSIALIIVHVKNWPQRSKRFNQLLKSKIQPLTARADRLTY